VTFDIHTHFVTQVLRGPLNSSFENGYFVVDVVNPIGYPFAPPQIKFCTKGMDKPQQFYLIIK